MWSIGCMEVDPSSPFHFLLIIEDPANFYVFFLAFWHPLIALRVPGAMLIFLIDASQYILIVYISEKKKKREKWTSHWE